MVAILCTEFILASVIAARHSTNTGCHLRPRVEALRILPELYVPHSSLISK